MYFTPNAKKTARNLVESSPAALSEQKTMDEKSQCEWLPCDAIGSEAVSKFTSSDPFKPTSRDMVMDVMQPADTKSGQRARKATFGSSVKIAKAKAPHATLVSDSDGDVHEPPSKRQKTTSAVVS